MPVQMLDFQTILNEEINEASVTDMINESSVNRHVTKLFIKRDAMII